MALAGLLAWPTLWALMLTQGCAVYTQYLFLTWLPSYLQTQKGMTMLKSGTLMALPFFGAVVLAVLLGLLSDRLLKRPDGAPVAAPHDGGGDDALLGGDPRRPRDL